MNKVIGYVLSVVGLVVLVLGSGFFGDVDFLGVGSLYISGAGILLVIVGAVLAVAGRGGHGKQGSEEIPIYEGVGKKRKIVGYRRG
jgi:hypothetical protein